MEYDTIEALNDENSSRNEATELTQSKSDVEGVLRSIPSPPENEAQLKMVDQKVVPPDEEDASGDINMEASISTDDMIRAGGFGARDDISNFLPVASDSTDFEATIRDARDYEEPQEEVCRPGLGWAEKPKE